MDFILDFCKQSEYDVALSTKRSPNAETRHRKGSHSMPKELKEQRGIIASLSRKKNFVFIRPEGEQRQIFCHRSEIDTDDDIEHGLPVLFDYREDDTDQATNVRLLP